MRVAIPVVVLDSTGAPKSGASVTVKNRSDNSNATVYAGETGGTTTANPMSTDSIGRVAGWIERGAYNLVVTGSGITGFTEPFDAAPAADGAILGAWVSAQVLPIGAIAPFAGASDPAGGQWLVCDGRAISRATYAALFTALSTTFGTGDGSATFNIPDLSGRVALGAGTPSANSSGESAMDGATAHTRGKKAGKEKHALAEAELAAHDHAAGYGGFLNVNLSDNNNVENGTITAGGTKFWQRVDHGSGVLANTANAGSDTAHENLPPHVVLNHIIRVI